MGQQGQAQASVPSGPGGVLIGYKVSLGKLVKAEMEVAGNLIQPMIAQKNGSLTPAAVAATVADKP
jgi:hypothetical protein